MFNWLTRAWRSIFGPRIAKAEVVEVIAKSHPISDPSLGGGVSGSRFPRTPRTPTPYQRARVRTFARNRGLILEDWQIDLLDLVMIAQIIDTEYFPSTAIMDLNLDANDYPVVEAEPRIGLEYDAFPDAGINASVNDELGDPPIDYDKARLVAEETTDTISADDLLAEEPAVVPVVVETAPEPVPEPVRYVAPPPIPEPTPVREVISEPEPYQPSDDSWRSASSSSSSSSSSSDSWGGSDSSGGSDYSSD